MGSGGNDTGSGTGAAGGTSTPADELAIALTGQNKYRADEGVSLSYTLSGSSADAAAVTYDGPVELTLIATLKPSLELRCCPAPMW